MIPYDDLVAALSAWRARQGLPVSTMGGVPASASRSGPHAANAPVETEDEMVDEAELVDEQYAEDYSSSNQATAPGPGDSGDFGRGGRDGPLPCPEHARMQRIRRPSIRGAPIRRIGKGQ